jgi:hypothetical protein
MSILSDTINCNTYFLIVGKRKFYRLLTEVPGVARENSKLHAWHIENDGLMVSYKPSIFDAAKCPRIPFPFQLLFCFGILILLLW